MKWWIVIYTIAIFYYFTIALYWRTTTILWLLVLIFLLLFTITTLLSIAGPLEDLHWGPVCPGLPSDQTARGFHHREAERRLWEVIVAHTIWFGNDFYHKILFFTLFPGPILFCFLFLDIINFDLIILFLFFYHGHNLFWLGLFTPMLCRIRGGIKNSFFW